MRSIGGIKDEGGEISSTLGGAKGRPGLINNKSGLSLDDATQRAWEEGYLGTHAPGAAYADGGAERPAINDLLDAIGEDHAGQARYSSKDEEAVAARNSALARNDEIDHLAKHYGIDHRQMTRAEFFDKIAERASFEEMSRTVAEKGDGAEADNRDMEERLRAWKESLGDAWEPDSAHSEGQPRTLEDLENDRRQEELAANQGAGAGDTPNAGPAAVDSQRGEERGGQGRGGAGDSGRDGPEGNPPGGDAGEGGGNATRGGRTERPAGPSSEFGDVQSDLVDKAGNIRIDNLDAPEDVNEAIREIARQNGDFLAERRGVVSDADLLGFAESVGLDPGQLNIAALKRISLEDQIPLGARILAGRKLMVQVATDVRDAMIHAGREGASDADVMAYAAARDKLAMIARTVAAVTAEWGRAGRGFRDLGGFADAAAMAKAVQESTGRTLFQLREEAKLGAQLQTPAQVAKFVKDMNLSRWQKVRAGILSYFINNLISGPLTHAGYSVGNTVWTLFKATADTSAAAAVGAAREMIAGEAVDRVYFGEVGAQLYGMARGMRDGLSPAVTALKTGVPFMKGDMEAAQGALALGEAATRQQAIPGKIGYVLETPSRSVSAIHTMFYGMNYEAEIARTAYRAATREGLEGDAFNSRVAELTQNPTQPMIEAAHAEALDMVLMRRPQFGSAQYNLQRAVNSNILAKMVMPFMQIGGNILREGYIEHTPLGLVSSAVRDDLSGKNGLAARDSQAAKIGVGVGISTAVLGLTAEGIITDGGPSDPREHALKEATGWKAYSVRVGDTYVPFRKFLGPLGPLVAGVADMYAVGHHMAEGDVMKAATGAAFGFAEVVADETWARGLANFIDAARHWDRDGGKYLRNLATDFIPFSIGMGQVAHLIDPYARQVHSVTDAFRSKIPGLSQELYPIRNWAGEPIQGGTIMSPSTAVHDPAQDAMERLQYYPTKPERKIRGVDLTDKQYGDLTRIAGRATKMRLEQIVTSPGFTSLPDVAQRDIIGSVFKGEREAARAQIMMQDRAQAPAGKAIIDKAVAAKTSLLHKVPGQ